MSDLISRQDAIKALGDAHFQNYGYAIMVVMDLPSAEPERWIPVTEALPEGKEIVLITNSKGHVRCGQYQGTFDDKNYHRWWWTHNTLETVLAWKPLPEPWRGE